MSHSISWYSKTWDLTSPRQSNGLLGQVSRDGSTLHRLPPSSQNSSQNAVAICLNYNNAESISCCIEVCSEGYTRPNGEREEQYIHIYIYM